jgi:SAM-dependent methyltransferase
MHVENRTSVLNNDSITSVRWSKLSESNGSLHDGLMLAHTVCDHMEDRLLLDLGCGKGLVGIYVAAFRASVDVIGIDINLDRCVTARRNAAALGIEGRYISVCGDALELFLSKEASVCCNPPLLPGENGFLYRDTNGITTFYTALIERLHFMGNRPSLYLHFFDCLGLFSKTGDLPSLYETVHSNSLYIKRLYTGSRPVALESRIRKSIPDLARICPDGEIIIGNSVIALKELARRKIDVFTADIRMPHSIVVIKKNRSKL